MIIAIMELQPLNQYYSHAIQLSIVHICPLDGLPNQSNCKRTVIAVQHNQTQQTTQTPNHNNERKYLVLQLYGSYAKTPFKKPELKVGQSLSLKRFQTHLMPKNKTFKCENGEIISNFYPALVLVKSEYEPIIKMINSSDIVVETENINVCNDNNNNSNGVTIDNEANNSNGLRDSEFSAQTLDCQYNDNCFTTDEAHHSCLKSSEVPCNKKKKSESNKTVNKTDSVSSNSKNSIHSESNSDHLNASSNQKYSYKKLLEIHNLQPVIGRTYVNLYGILIKNDQNNAYIYLADETIHSFEIKLLPCKSGVRYYPPFRTGDIIRIHRLLLKPNSIKECICMHPKDLVVFEAFKDSDLFNRLTCASECTIEESDKTRKIELEEWFSNQLLEESLSKLKHFGYVNIAAQLLKVQTTQNRSVLHIWDATQPSLKTCNRFSYDNHSYQNEPLISLIDPNDMSLYITVYDEHSIGAAKLKPFDIIVIFNAHIKDDQRNAGLSNIALNSTYRFGKCIRFVDNNSYLGKKLLTRIEEYKVMSAMNTTDGDEMGMTDDISQFPTQSQPIISDSLLPEDVDQNQSTNQRTSTHLSDSDSDNLADNIVELIEAQASYLPSVIIVDIPDKSISIQSLLNNAIDKAFYKIQARVATYLVYDIKDVVSVLCTNKDYHHLIPVSEANVQINELINDKNELNCLRCKSIAKLFFRVCFIIEDTNRDRLTAELIGYDAQLFFGATPLQVLSEPEKLSHVQQVFKFLCTSKCSSFVFKIKNTLFNWVIQPTKISTDPTKFIYRIRTVTQIDKLNKSVGINFNT